MLKTIQELHHLFLAYPKISTDTRESVENSLFFALSGTQFNGNKFARQALDGGAAWAVVDDPEVAAGEGNFFLVNNVLQALQDLALFHRENSKALVIGITGTNGKTTTKELVAAVLRTEKTIIATQGNFNNHIGVPLTLLQIQPSTQIAVIEMGANHPGEIEQLCELARPNLGIITNIGKAHLEGFGSYQGVIHTKNELYRFLRTHNGTVLVNADDPLLMELSEDMHRITYGTGNADLIGELSQSIPDLQIIIDAYNDHQLELNSPLYGSYNFANIMAAVAVARYFGVKRKHVKKAIEGYVPTNNRSQQLTTPRNKLFMDAYNANPVSMQAAISSFHDAGYENPMLILGDMFELGDMTAEEHKAIISLIKSLNITHVLLVGEAFTLAAKSTEIKAVRSTAEAMDYLSQKDIRNYHILLKGSRGMKLEKLTGVL